MNLANNPQIEELKDILRQCDDTSNHHMVWIDKVGNVNIDPIPNEYTPAGYSEIIWERMKFRYETLQQNNGYVGKEAANDEAWVSRLFNGLINDWNNNSLGYKDYF